MGQSRSGWCALMLVVAWAVGLGGCGGHKPAGASPFPAKITLTPAVSVSLQLGATQSFNVTATNSAGGNISPGFTFASSDTSIVTMSPTGIACAGSWNAPSYSVCTPGGIGVAKITATALGETSIPTYVFVHAHIDNIQISYVPPVNSPPPACPTQQALPAACNIPFNHNNCSMTGNSYSCACFSQNQVATLQAAAISQGADITASVGPITWSQASGNVVKITPVVDPVSGLATDQAAATPAGTPGQTQIFATVSGITSQAYQFEACPVQCISLEVGAAGSGVTSFITNKGTAETIAATAVDVQGCIVPKPPLTWTSSEPAALSAGITASSCTGSATCTVTTPQPAAASITATCTPPACNLGFPLNPAGLAAPYIPQPVYPVVPISGLAIGAASATSVLATSVDCLDNPYCTVAVYNVATGKNVAGNATQLPRPPNSLLIDPTGAKAYMGSQFGSVLVAIGGIGGSTNPFTVLPATGTPTGLVTGKALAVSATGGMAVFSDTVSSPNRAYVVNTTSVTPVTTALNISGATAAAFSPDGLRGYILGCAPGQSTCPNNANSLYTYSTLQALQTTSLGTGANGNSISFSSSGAFAYINEGLAGSPGTIAVNNVCDNSSAMTIPTANTPTVLKTIPPALLPITVPGLSALDGINVLMGIDSSGTDTGFDIIVTTAAGAPLTALCPQSASLPPNFNFGAVALTNPYHASFGEGPLQPINFFLSPDGSQIFLVPGNSNRILVYTFNTGSVTAIPLANSITGQSVYPISADITVDGTLIYVATSDGTLHEISTTFPGEDLAQVPFPPLVNSNSGFCTNVTTLCALNLIAVRP